MAGRSFSQDIGAFVEKTGLSLNLVLRKLAFDAFAGLLMRSPVDTGRFRASWRIGINRVDLSVEPERADSLNIRSRFALQSAPAPSGGLIQTAKFGDTIHLSNNLPYAQALEHGHSKQAPQGVLGRTFDQIILDFAREHK